MGANSAIEWTDHTFNPWIGCQKVSPGCDHCYAEAMMDHRLGRVEWGPHGERRRTSVANWRKPLQWAKAANGTRPKVFCASLADVFDNQVPAAWRRDLFDLIWATPELDWLLLTKRPENIAKMLPGAIGEVELWPWRNVWLGVSAERQEEADQRIPHLLATPAEVRFVSAEPLLGRINFTRIATHGGWYDALKGWRDVRTSPAPEGIVDWIIAGGESGKSARPTHPDWVRSIRDQCQASGTAFFFKQWGEWAPGDAFGLVQDGAVYDRRGHVRDWLRRYVVCEDRADRLTAHTFTKHGTNLVYRVGKHRAGRLLDGREWKEFPR